MSSRDYASAMVFSIFLFPIKGCFYLALVIFLFSLVNLIKDAISESSLNSEIKKQGEIDLERDVEKFIERYNKRLNDYDMDCVNFLHTMSFFDKKTHENFYNDISTKFYFPAPIYQRAYTDVRFIYEVYKKNPDAIMNQMKYCGLLYDPKRREIRSLRADSKGRITREDLYGNFREIQI